MNICPICRSEIQDIIHTLDCGNMDSSRLYPTIRLVSCLRCGHVFNALSPEELKGLECYYDEELSPINLNAIYTKGDRPGSSDSLAVVRYGQLLTNLMPYIRVHDEILDVGCAMGGLLDYLYAKGFNRLCACDMSQAYVEYVRMNGRHRIKLGNAEALPFEDHVFDVIIMEQVLEHLPDPVKAFAEAKRVLRPGGVFYIEVPDASRYSDFYYFDYYYLLIREHIQHFDVDHLELLAEQQGFDMLSYRQTSNAVISEQMIMPSLSAIFRSTNSPHDDKIRKNIDYFGLRQKMTDYIRSENAKQLMRSGRIAELAKSCRPVYVWGIGKEFLYLYEAAGLKHCNIEGLIDMNPLKQKTAFINGTKVRDDSLLRESSVDSVLLITVIAHTDSIIQNVKSYGFKGEIITMNHQ